MASNIYASSIPVTPRYPASGGFEMNMSPQQDMMLPLLLAFLQAQEKSQDRDLENRRIDVEKMVADSSTRLQDAQVENMKLQRELQAQEQRSLRLQAREQDRRTAYLSQVDEYKKSAMKSIDAEVERGGRTLEQMVGNPTRLIRSLGGGVDSRKIQEVHSFLDTLNKALNEEIVQSFSPWERIGAANKLQRVLEQLETSPAATDSSVVAAIQAVRDGKAEFMNTYSTGNEGIAALKEMAGQEYGHQVQKNLQQVEARSRKGRLTAYDLAGDVKAGERLASQAMDDAWDSAAPPEFNVREVFPQRTVKVQEYSPLPTPGLGSRIGVGVERAMTDLDRFLMGTPGGFQAPLSQGAPVVVQESPLSALMKTPPRRDVSKDIFNILYGPTTTLPPDFIGPPAPNEVYYLPG